MLVYLRFFIFLTIVFGLINCVKIKLGSEIRHGLWTTEHRISFPFTIHGEHYFFGLTDLTIGRYWFIQKLGEDGNPSLETDNGTWDGIYTLAFPFTINGKQFMYGIDDEKYWFIQEILPGGKMGTKTDDGHWKSKPTIIFPFSIGNKYYVYSLSDNNWFIKELLPNGKIGYETDHGTFELKYTLGFPFSIYGRQYLYCFSSNYWFIQELLPGGMIGDETDKGHWTTIHKLYVPFSIDNKHYFYGVTDASDEKDHWFIQELLPGGKMGTMKTHGSWDFSYKVQFSFYINGRQFLYGVRKYNWFVQEIIQDPRLPIATIKNRKYCEAPSHYHALRSKRQVNNNNNNNVPRRREYGGLNAVEEYVTAIENDDNFVTAIPNNPGPIRSISTFEVGADENHETPIVLTAAMRAEIHPHHLTAVRDSISQEVYQHLGQMDRESDDEAGHLLASSLGGSGAPANFAPQSPMMNRGARVMDGVVEAPGWHQVEEMIRSFLRACNGFIRWSLLPEYALLPNSRRPTAFALSIRFYNEQGNLFNYNGNGAVVEYNFQNVPTQACLSFDHSWWN